jgi:tRNA (guanine26-N2/guanine27-N2)-dimethyltransferase
MQEEFLIEGNCKIKAYTDDIVSRKLPVFFNPIMKNNRDFTLLILSVLNKKDYKICLPLAGSGIRAIRILKELDANNVKQITLNDINSTAVDRIKTNFKLNEIDITPRIDITNLDAIELLSGVQGYDYIDIDPFGSPNNFLDLSIKRLSRDGILAVTATDTGCLAGTYALACKRKYFSKPLHCQNMHEIGLRILIRKVQLLGIHQSKSLRPIFSFFKDHYFKIFFKAEKGRKKCDELIKEFGYYLFCKDCLYQTTTPDIFDSTNTCPNCKNKLDYAGPLWLGSLWDTQIVEDILTKAKESSQFKDLVKFIEIIFTESKLNIPFFYHIPSFLKVYKQESLRKKSEIFSLVSKSGFKVVSTHFKEESIRSDIDLHSLKEILLKKEE